MNLGRVEGDRERRIDREEELLVALPQYLMTAMLDAHVAVAIFTSPPCPIGSIIKLREPCALCTASHHRKVALRAGLLHTRPGAVHKPAARSAVRKAHASYSRQAGWLRTSVFAFFAGDTMSRDCLVGLRLLRCGDPQRSKGSWLLRGEILRE